MALQSSGSITLAQIASEFGDSQPHALSEFYAGGSAGVLSAGAPNVPSSGAIDFNDFYGASDVASVSVASNATNRNAATLFGSNWSPSIPKILQIESGVEVGASSLSNYAINVPSGMGGTLNIKVYGTVSGAGGDGSSTGTGGDGGTAIYIASSNVTVTNSGTIRGGGGGGGKGGNGSPGNTTSLGGGLVCYGGQGGTGGAGGNGQGYDQSQSNGSGGGAGGAKFSSPSSGAAFCNWTPGNYSNGSPGSSGGNGGTYGNAGNAGTSGSPGGAAGKYIQLSGVSYTLANGGTLQGTAP